MCSLCLCASARERQEGDVEVGMEMALRSIIPAIPIAAHPQTFDKSIALADYFRTVLIHTLWVQANPRPLNTPWSIFFMMASGTDQRSVQTNDITINLRILSAYPSPWFPARIRVSNTTILSDCCWTGGRAAGIVWSHGRV